MASGGTKQVCGACGPQFERPAADYYEATSVTESHLDVHVREDGTARYVVRNRVSAATADYFDDHPGELAAVARAAVGDDRRNVTARLDGRTVVITSVDPSAARSSFGVTVYDDYRSERRVAVDVNAETVTVHAPGDHRLASDPDADRTNATAVTWEGETGEGGWIDDSFTHRSYVAFASEGTVAPGTRARLAAAAAVAPLFVRQSALVLLPVVYVLGITLVATLVLGDWAREWDQRTVGLACVALGTVAFALTLAHATLTDSPRELPLVVVAGFVALTPPAVTRFSPRSFPGTALLTGGLALVAGTLVAVGYGQPTVRPPLPLSLILLVPAELALFVLLGYARGIDHRHRHGLALLTVLPFLAFAVEVLPVFGGFTWFFLIIKAGLSAGAVAVLGLPLFCLGVSIADGSSTYIDPLFHSRGRSE